MKLKVAAAAVLALSAGCAVAAEGTSVIVYGLIDSALVFEHGGPKGSAIKLESGVASGNRLGFRGSEDLGGGMKAIFTIENGFVSDTGAADQGGTLFGRQAFVGLQTPQGTVTMGRQYTPTHRVLVTLDPFNTNYAGSANRLMHAEDAGVRMNNSIIYASPKLGGFSGEIAYGFGEVAGNTSASRALGFNATYKTGPIDIVAGYMNQNNATDTDSVKNTLVGATYNFGVAVASLGYGMTKGAGSTDMRDTLLGVTVPMGRHTILASLVHKSDRSGVTNYGANQAAIGYTYSLSKRTMFYTDYAKLSNINYTTTKFGSGDREFDVGVMHTF